LSASAASVVASAAGLPGFSSPPNQFERLVAQGARCRTPLFAPANLCSSGRSRVSALSLCFRPSHRYSCARPPHASPAGAQHRTAVELLSERGAVSPQPPKVVALCRPLRFDRVILVFGVLLMKYRNIEYSIVQDLDRNSWKWSVSPNESTVQSGTRKTHEAALTAVVLTIDRWKARSPKIEANQVPDGECHAAVV